MRIVIDKLEADFYGDIILTEEDIEALQMGEIVEASTDIHKQAIYLGAFLQKGIKHEKATSRRKKDLT
jgi:hypothetical protein